MTRKRILIVGINYAPEPTGIAPYTTAIAEHLAANEAEVTVVAGPPSYPLWKVDPGERGWHRVQGRNGVELHRLWHYVPSTQTGSRRAVYEATFGLHAMTAVRRIARQSRPTVVFAVIPSLAGAAAAARVAKDLKVPLVVHVQDLMGRAATQSGMTGAGPFAVPANKLEAWTLRQATRVAVVSEAFVPVVKEYGVADKAIVRLPNWTHIDKPKLDRNEVRSALGWGEGVRVALHTGNIGYKQDLGNIVEAARLSTDQPDLLWVLMGDGSQHAQLAEQAAGLPNFAILPPCSDLDYPDVLAAADVLLVNERASVGEMSLPSKLTSYVAAGRPVVAAVPVEGATAGESKRLLNASIVPPGDPAALVDAVLQAPLGAPVASASQNAGDGDWRAAVEDLITFP